MKKVILAIVLIGALGLVVGCNSGCGCEPDPCCEPVYVSPCCPAPSQGMGYTSGGGGAAAGQSCGGAGSSCG